MSPVVTGIFIDRFPANGLSTLFDPEADTFCRLLVPLQIANRIAQAMLGVPQVGPPEGVLDAAGPTGDLECLHVFPVKKRARKIDSNQRIQRIIFALSRMGGEVPVYHFVRRNLKREPT